MMPITRQQIEILLETPKEHDYIVSAYADMTVKDGFRSYVDTNLRNQARAAEEALKDNDFRKTLDANIDVIRQAVQDNPEPAARGLAVFSNVATGYRQVLPLHFPVHDPLVIKHT